MSIIDKLSYQLLKKNEYIGDFNEEYQIGEKPIGLKKKLSGAAYMMTHLYWPKYRSEIFEPHVIKAYDLEKMKKKIDKVDVVSFDIFDTLLLRPVYRPRDMFYFVENENHVVDFRRKRVRAEEWAREHTDKKNGEINIFDIYQHIEEWCGIDAEKSALKEIEIEKEYCFAHPFVKKLYNYALEQKKTVIATSDMYIPKEYMNEILSEKGYTCFYDTFVSCDYQENKSRGNLYQIIQNIFLNKKILHIGDNRYSDIVMAQKNGLSTIWIQNVNRTGKRFRQFQSQSLMSSVHAGLVDAYLYSGVNKQVEKCKNPFYLYGFLCGGPLTYGLCQWIDDLQNKKNADKVLFLARDGYIVSEVYKKYFNDVNSIYAYASRQALLPVLCVTDYEMYLQEAFYKRIVYSKMKPVKALKDIGIYSCFDVDLQNEIQQKLGLDEITWTKFKEWMLEKKSLVQSAYQIQLQAATKYFKELIGNSKNIIIFDLGWRGTSILYLKKYLESQVQDVNITGAMLGIQEMPMTELHALHHSIEGYMFSQTRPSVFSRINGQKIMFLKERFALEFMYTSLENSLLEYYIEDDTCKFRFEEKNSGTNDEIIKNMHNGIRDYIDWYVKLLPVKLENIRDYRMACLPMWQMLKNYKILKLFKKYSERKTTLHGFEDEET